MFVLRNIRTYPFLTNTLHIIRRDSWKIHVTVPTLSFHFIGVYETHQNARRSVNLGHLAIELCTHEYPINLAIDRRVWNSMYMNLSRQVGKKRGVCVRQVRLHDRTLLLSNGRFRSISIRSQKDRVLASPGIIARIIN